MRVHTCSVDVCGFVCVLCFVDTFAVVDGVCGGGVLLIHIYLHSYRYEYYIMTLCDIILWLVENIGY